MKILLISLALLFAVVLHGTCQKRLRAVAGVTQQLSLQRATYNLEVSPMGGMRIARHQCTVGPLLRLADFPAAGNHYPTLTGALANYQYRVSKSASARLQLMAELSSKVQFLREQWQSNYWDASTARYQEQPMASREIRWGTFAGLGISYQLNKALAIKTSLAAGYSLSRLQAVGTSPMEPQAEFDYRPYDNGGLCYALGLSLYYTFP